MCVLTHVFSVGRREGDQGLQTNLLESGNGLSQVARPLRSQMPQRNSGSWGQSCPHGLLAQLILGCNHVKHQITAPPESWVCAGLPEFHLEDLLMGRMA